MCVALHTVINRSFRTALKCTGDVSGPFIISSTPTYTCVAVRVFGLQQKSLYLSFDRCQQLAILPKVMYTLLYGQQNISPSRGRRLQGDSV